MENLIVLKESELRQIIREEIQGCTQPEEPEKEIFSIDEAVEYLVNKGFRITKNTLYAHTHNGTIDYFRFGKRKLSFTREQLDDFLRKMRSK